MLAVGRLGPPRAAQAFADYLATQGVRVRLEADGEACVLYALEAEQAGRIQAELQAFLANPGAVKYRDASWRAGKPQADTPGHGLDLRHLLARAGTITKLLAGLSIALTLLTGFGDNEDMLRYFLISNYPVGLFEVRAGQIYRLLTPIFLHFMVIHILFNLMWLWDLGGAIERRWSGGYLLALVAGTGIASNLAQYAYSGPLFGGLSGVVYGLLGFTWLRGHFDPACGLAVPRAVVSFMLVWLALCFTGLLGPVANAAHLTGLIAGALWGWLSALLARPSRSR